MENCAYLRKNPGYVPAYEKIGVAGSHFCTHGHTIDLFIITASE